MEPESAPAPRRRHRAIDRAARQKRIFARLREGWAYDEIARMERLTPKRVRKIVADVLQRRQVDDSSAHALVQLARLAPALQIAGEAVVQGDVRAIGPLIQVDRLDRYQTAAQANQVYDEESRDKLLDRVNRKALVVRAQDARKEQAARLAEAWADSSIADEAGADDHDFLQLPRGGFGCLAFDLTVARMELARAGINAP